MKVLFLDCDGVLNDDRDAQITGDERPYFVLNFEKLRLLKGIIEETGCLIVLSSSWRCLDGGVEVLKNHGIPIHSVTKNLGGIRGEEIQEWLDEHPEVTNYAIVDDDCDMLDSQFKHFVNTDPTVGLTPDRAYRIKKRLEIDIVKPANYIYTRAEEVPTGCEVKVYLSVDKNDVIIERFFAIGPSPSKGLADDFAKRTARSLGIAFLS